MLATLTKKLKVSSLWKTINRINWRQVRVSSLGKEVYAKSLELRAFQARLGNDFENTLSLNTVHRCIKKFNLKLSYTRGKPHINSAEMNSLDTNSSQMDRKTVDTWSVVRRVQVSAAFGRNWCWILCAKAEKDHPGCDQIKVQKPASVILRGCIYVRVPLNQRCMLEFWRDIFSVPKQIKKCW